MTMNFPQHKDACLNQISADGTLKARDLRIGIQIILHLHRKKLIAWPGMGTLAKICKCSRRTVIRSVAALEKAGHISVSRRWNGDTKDSHQYRFNLKPAATATIPDTRVMHTGALGGVHTGAHNPVIHSESDPVPLKGGRLRSRPQEARYARKGVGEEEREGQQPESQSKPPSSGSLKAQCFALARDLGGDRASSMTALAIDVRGIEDTWEALCAWVKAGGYPDLIDEFLGPLVHPLGGQYDQRSRFARVS